MNLKRVSWELWPGALVPCIALICTACGFKGGPSPALDDPTLIGSGDRFANEVETRKAREGASGRPQATPNANANATPTAKPVSSPTPKGAP